MATRQYIGARYVPKFYQNSVDGSTQWESNVVYDPLIYVTLQNGHMYISKKQVPATIGTPASNINYWLDVGSYDGYIDDLQNQINDMKDGSVSGSLQAQINATNDEVDDMKDGRVSGSLQSQINTINDEINDDDIVNRETIFVGDSYGDGSTEFINATISALGMTHAHNLAVSGAGFVSDGTHTFQQQIQGYTGNKSAVKAIYVCGGLNDSTSTITSGTTLETAINSFVSYAHTYYPNAKLYLVYVGNALDGASAIAGRTLAYRQQCKYIYSARQDFEFVDLSGYLGRDRANLSTDGIHPSNYGTLALRDALMAWMRGSLNKVIYPQILVGMTNSGNVSGFNNIYYCIDGDLLTIMFEEDFAVSFTQGQTLDVNWIEVASLSKLYFNRTCNIVVPCRLDGFNSLNFQNALLEWKFDHDKLYLRSVGINDNGTGFKTFTGTSGSPKARMISNCYRVIDAGDVN